MYRSSVPAGGGGPVGPGGVAGVVGEGAGVAVAAAGLVVGAEAVGAALGVAGPLHADTSNNAAIRPAAVPRGRMAPYWPARRPDSTPGGACRDRGTASLMWTDEGVA
jgi:hypothetical protein